MIKAYIDGACRGNPGVGGWGALIIASDGSTYALKGADRATTNNRMEIKACIEALKFIKEKFPDEEVSLTTDSKYLKDAANVWIKTWYKNGWRTSSNTAVKNKDLWLEYIKVRSGLSIQWTWVKGHSGHEGNEKADWLANQAIDSLKE